MKTLRFWKLDAFTDGRSEGNPAGLIWLGETDSLGEAEMQKLARELAGSGFVSEVAFARAAGNGDIGFRYFSREREVPFCGHATIAALHHLCSTMPEYAARPRLLIQTQKGPLEVENRIAAEQSVYITAPSPVFTNRFVPASETLAALGLATGAFTAGAGDSLPIVECGQRCLLVPVSSLSILQACTPLYAKLRTLSEAHDFEIMLLYSKETYIPGMAFRTRVFAPAFGYLEDPATGSGNAALAHWLRHTGQWRESQLPIEQGPSTEAPNLVTLRSRNDGVLQIGGRAIVRISGDYLLH